MRLDWFGNNKIVHFLGIYFEFAFGRLPNLTSSLSKAFFGCFEVTSQEIVQMIRSVFKTASKAPACGGTVSSGKPDLRF